MKRWAVTFWAKETGRVNVDTFAGKTTAKAVSSFNAVYRHETYKILSVVEVPEAQLRDNQVYAITCPFCGRKHRFVLSEKYLSILAQANLDLIEAGFFVARKITASGKGAKVGQ